MTISSTVSKVVANGNSAATSFSFSPMTIFEDTDMTVTLVDNLGNETLLVEGIGGTNFAVVMTAGFPGTGAITYPASGAGALPTGWQIVMKPVLPLTQNMALTTQGPYAPDTQMAAFDRLTVIDQQQQEQMDRSVTLPIGVAGVNPTLPAPVASTFIGWASNALSLVNYGIAGIGATIASAYSLTLLLLANAAAWRAGLGSTAVGDALFTTASAAAARTTLGVGNVLLQTQTVGAAVSSVNFTANIDGTYDEYLFVFSGMVAATAATDFLVRISQDGGATYKAGTSYQWAKTLTATNATTSITASAGDSAVRPFTNASAVAGQGFSGELRMFNPGVSSVTKNMMFNAWGFFSGGTILGHYSGGGCYTPDGNIVNAIQFFMLAGNIAAGTISLYGVRK